MINNSTFIDDHNITYYIAERDNLKSKISLYNKYHRYECLRFCDNRGGRSPCVSRSPRGNKKESIRRMLGQLRVVRRVCTKEKIKTERDIFHPALAFCSRV